MNWVWKILLATEVFLTDFLNTLNWQLLFKRIRSATFRFEFYALVQVNTLNPRGKKRITCLKQEGKWEVHVGKQLGAASVCLSPLVPSSLVSKFLKGKKPFCSGPFAWNMEVTIRTWSPPFMVYYSHLALSLLGVMINRWKGHLKKLIPRTHLLQGISVEEISVET